MSGFKVNVKQCFFVLMVLSWTHSVNSSETPEGKRYILETSKELTENEKSDYNRKGFDIIRQVNVDNGESFYYALKESTGGSATNNDGNSGTKGSIQQDDQNIERKVELLRQITTVIKLAEDEKVDIFPRAVPTINDPEWSNMWHLQTSQSPSMGIQEAWSNGYNGNGVVVSIVDDGIERTHTDLTNKYQAAYSYDYVYQDAIPDHSSGESHGTNCAGIVSAERNTFCIVGIAFEANLAAVKILDSFQSAFVSDQASTLIHSLANIDIYSNSWGPSDDGTVFSSLHSLVEDALITGVTTGRGGKGAIYTWASGNGGQNDDDCNCDGFSNSIYTIAVASASNTGNPTFYSEKCTAILGATYGGDQPNPRISTTEVGDTCTSTFQGTSAATPVASGIIALLLQAKPALTWRDVQHLIVETSSLTGLSSTGVITNAASKQVSEYFGFGLMNADSLITRAATWSTVPTQVRCDETLVTSASSGTSQLDSTHTVSTCSIQYLEHVRATITFRAGTRGKVQFFLLSPGGTSNQLLHARSPDTANMVSDESFTFMSVHSWGENSSGTWTLRMASEDSSISLSLVRWQLILYGTQTDPQSGTSSSDDGVSTAVIVGATLGGIAAVGVCGAAAFGIYKLKVASAVAPVA